jgi:two-component system, cell cycle response regulator
VGFNVLVVDDSESVRSMMRRVLEEAGLDFEVTEANDGAEALPVALSGEIDLVISDIVMPKLDGIQLLRGIRQQKDAETLPVILLTSQSDAETRSISFDAGASDYLYKPFSAAELLSRVQVQLRLRLLQDELRRANERHRRLGTHDELTGLSNRRHFLDQSRRELARSRRHKFDLSICAVDIDNFRRINLKQGHMVGDAIIAEMGTIIERNLRIPDMLARLAGGKFMALLPQTDVPQARIVCERLRSAAAGHAFPGQVAGELCLSLGLASYPMGRLESVDELLNAAEASLDRAKILGGNRIEVWGDDPAAITG